MHKSKLATTLSHHRRSRMKIETIAVHAGRHPDPASGAVEIPIHMSTTFKRNEDVLGERSFAMVAGPLPPGGRTEFSQALDDPPVGTTDIVPIVE